MNFILIIVMFILLIGLGYIIYQFGYCGKVLAFVIPILTAIGFTVTIYQHYTSVYKDRILLYNAYNDKTNHLNNNLMTTYPYSERLIQETNGYVSKEEYKLDEQWRYDRLCEQILLYIENLYIIATHNLPTYYNTRASQKDKELRSYFERELGKWFRAESIQRYWKDHSQKYLIDFVNYVNDYGERVLKWNIEQ